MPPNGAEGPQAQQYEQIHNPNLGAETTAGQELRRVSEQTDKMHVAVQRSQKEINNNAHWGPFQQAERLYQQAFTREFVGNDPTRHFARADEGDRQNPNAATILANQRLNKALQEPGNAALRARVRTWKESVCKQINEQWRKAGVDWTAGPGLDTNANFDAQKGQEYRDIRPDQQVIEGGLREYNQALQKFYKERAQAQPGRPARPPTMVDMFNFKIDWCNKKNAELDKQEQEANKQGVRPADGRFYAGLAWSPTIAWVPGGRSVAGRLQPRPAEGPQVQAKTQGETEAQAKAKGSEDAEQRGKEGVAKEGRVKEAQAKEGQTKEQTEKEVEEKNKADEAKAKAEAEAKAKEDLVRHEQEIRKQTTEQGAEPIADLDVRLRTAPAERAKVLQQLVADFQARGSRLVDIAIESADETNFVLRYTPRAGTNERVSNILRQANISPMLNGTLPGSHTHGGDWARAMMAVNVFRGTEEDAKTIGETEEKQRQEKLDKELEAKQAKETAEARTKWIEETRKGLMEECQAPLNQLRDASTVQLPRRQFAERLIEEVAKHLPQNPTEATDFRQMDLGELPANMEEFPGRTLGDVYNNVIKPANWQALNETFRRLFTYIELKLGRDQGRRLYVMGSPNLRFWLQ